MIILPLHITITLIITHKSFNTGTHMVHFTQKRLDYFTGNYDSFVNTLEEKNGEQEKRYKQEQDQIQHMKDYVAKFGQGNSKMAKQAQSKEKVR